MKSARKNYEELQGLSAAERLVRMEEMKGLELCSLKHYTEGREEGLERDQILGLILVVSAERYLAKQAVKAAKRVKRIL